MSRERVHMRVFGLMAVVDADMVKKLEKKERLVAEVMNLQKFINADPAGHAYAMPLLLKTSAQIRRLNKSIRPTVEFLE